MVCELECHSGRRKITARDISKAKGQGSIVMVTAYDHPTARLVDEAGVDIILVGDSLGMVVLGYETTHPVTMEDMLRHTEAVARANPCALVVGDMPFMSYEADVRDAVLNAGAFVRAGAEAVKLEGGTEVVDVVKAIGRAGIPVMGHVGLTPQRALKLGGFRRMGKGEEAKAIVEDAKALEDAGAFSIVIEFTRADVARMVTESVSIPTICIGSGPYCDGQVLVLHDIIGLSPITPPFAKRYADASSLIREAVKAFVEDVRSKNFPEPSHYK